MEKVTSVVVRYVPSDKIELQGKQKDIEKYLRQGYHVQEERNGYWVLTKNVQVLMTLTNSTCTNTFNIKEDVLSYYNKQRISNSMVNQFENDINSGKICIKMSEDGTRYSIE